MNFINLSYFIFLVILVTFGEEIQIKNVRRNRYKSVGPLSNSSSPMTSTTTTTATSTPMAAAPTEIKKVEDDENNAKHSNDTKSLINNHKHDDVVISTTETLKRMTRPTRNNQALFSALKKRRKDAYQNKTSKKLTQQFEDDTLAVTKHDQSDHEADKKFTKKSSTYRNKSKHAQKKDGYAEDKEAAAIITDKKTRRFSVRV